MHHAPGLHLEQCPSCLQCMHAADAGAAQDADGVVLLGAQQEGASTWRGGGCAASSMRGPRRVNTDGLRGPSASEPRASGWSSLYMRPLAASWACHVCACGKPQCCADVDMHMLPTQQMQGRQPHWIGNSTHDRGSGLAGMRHTFRAASASSTGSAFDAATTPCRRRRWPCAWWPCACPQQCQLPAALVNCRTAWPAEDKAHKDGGFLAEQLATGMKG